MKTVRVLGSRSNAAWLHSLYDEIVPIEYGHQLPDGKTPLCDLLLFTGGQDLQPSMYKKNYPEIYGSSVRDKWETEWFNWAVANKVPMFGICRGMQLFTALAGGELIPHVEGHYGRHEVYTPHYSPNSFTVNSIHHQMCVPPLGTIKLAWAKNIAFRGPAEPEALWFPKIKALGVQWHPEMMPTNSEATQFVHHKIKEYLL